MRISAPLSISLHYPWKCCKLTSPHSIAAAEAIGLFKSGEEMLTENFCRSGRPSQFFGRVRGPEERGLGARRNLILPGRAGPALAPFLRIFKERLLFFCEKLAIHHFSARIRVQKAQYPQKLAEG